MGLFGKPKNALAYRHVEDFSRAWDQQRVTIMSDIESNQHTIEQSLQKVYRSSVPAQKGFLLVPTLDTAKNQSRAIVQLTIDLQNAGLPGAELLAPNLSKFGVNNSTIGATLSYYKLIHHLALRAAAAVDGGIGGDSLGAVGASPADGGAAIAGETTSASGAAGAAGAGSLDSSQSDASKAGPVGAGANSMSTSAKSAMGIGGQEGQGVHMGMGEKVALGAGGTALAGGLMHAAGKSTGNGAATGSSDMNSQGQGGYRSSTIGDNMPPDSAGNMGEPVAQNGSTGRAVAPGAFLGDSSTGYGGQMSSSQSAGGQPQMGAKGMTPPPFGTPAGSHYNSSIGSDQVSPRPSSTVVYPLRNQQEMEEQHGSRLPNQQQDHLYGHSGNAAVAPSGMDSGRGLGVGGHLGTPGNPLLTDRDEAAAAGGGGGSRGFAAPQATTGPAGGGGQQGSGMQEGLMAGTVGAGAGALYGGGFGQGQQGPGNAMMGNSSSSRGYAPHHPSGGPSDYSSPSPAAAAAASIPQEPVFGSQQGQQQGQQQIRTMAASPQMFGAPPPFGSSQMDAQSPSGSSSSRQKTVSFMPEGASPPPVDSLAQVAGVRPEALQHHLAASADLSAPTGPGGGSSAGQMMPAQVQTAVAQVAAHLGVSEAAVHRSLQATVAEDPSATGLNAPAPAPAAGLDEAQQQHGGGGSRSMAMPQQQQQQQQHHHFIGIPGDSTYSTPSQQQTYGQQYIDSPSGGGRGSNGLQAGMQPQQQAGAPSQHGMAPALAGAGAMGAAAYPLGNTSFNSQRPTGGQNFGVGPVGVSAATSSMAGATRGLPQGVAAGGGGGSSQVRSVEHLEGHSTLKDWAHAVLPRDHDDATKAALQGSQQQQSGTSAGAPNQTKGIDLQQGAAGAGYSASGTGNNTGIHAGPAGPDGQTVGSGASAYPAAAAGTAAAGTAAGATGGHHNGPDYMVQPTPGTGGGAGGIGGKVEQLEHKIVDKVTTQQLKGPLGKPQGSRVTQAPSGANAQPVPKRKKGFCGCGKKSMPNE
eukprot:jgi/Mesen1/8484/ME000048S07949